MQVRVRVRIRIRVRVRVRIRDWMGFTLGLFLAPLGLPILMKRAEEELDKIRQRVRVWVKTTQSKTTQDKTTQSKT